MRYPLQTPQQHKKLFGQLRVAEHAPQSVAERIRRARAAHDIVAAVRLSGVMHISAHAGLNDQPTEMLRADDGGMT